jgi:serine/threonine protein kinase
MPSTPVAVAQLVVVAGPDAGQVCLLPARRLALIGRGSRCDVRLTDPAVSRVHCRLEMAAGRITLVDAGSSWGTQVNGQAVSRQLLERGDRIEIGDTELEVQFDDDLVATTPPRSTPAVDRPPTSPPPRDLTAWVGRTFLRYDVESLVARSPTGVVFRATDQRASRTVALKLYWPAMFPDETSQARFLRSIRAMVKLSHPHLVKLHAAGRSQGLCFTASEFIAGESTADLIRRIGIAGMLDWQTAWRMGVGLASAVEYLHGRQILHRSVLPNNILIRAADQTVKLGDSTLAKALDDSGVQQLTQRGEVVGDLRYLSPEQLSGASVIDARADLYGLGATLYAVLTGRPPFVGSPTEVVAQALAAPPEPPSKHHLAIPPTVEGIVLRLLAKRPDDRYESATQLLRELQRVGRFLGVANG